MNTLAGIFFRPVKGIFAVCLFLSVLTGYANAQDARLEAAKAVMEATGVTSRLDSILPEVAAFTKTGLIANRPDIEAEISQIVDETAISLAARRGPLEEEVAKIYVDLFSVEELEQIKTFFGSEAGIKFLDLTPNIYRQVDEASKLWRTGITRDMADMVQKKMEEQGLQ